MTEIVYSDELKFDGAVLPVHLASDRQIYVQLADVCSLVGLDPKGMAYRVQQDISTVDLLVFMTPPGDDNQAEQPAKAAFLNLAALPYWLGMVASDRVEHRNLHDQLARYTFDFLDTTWMHYRAAVHDLERAGIGRTRIGGRRNQPRLPTARARN